ncbi:hypothetical protein, partial [Pantoea agglomerans]|uniref:hypothetical protein n=1 Tax=Enterobacter agglomerans TaxID=549 RepID=UPI003208F784
PYILHNYISRIMEIIMKSNRREIIVFERSLKLNVRFWHKADVDICPDQPILNNPNKFIG